MYSSGRCQPDRPVWPEHRGDLSGSLLDVPSGPCGPAGNLGRGAVADVLAGAEGGGEGGKVHGLQHRADALAPVVDAGRRDLREFPAYCFQQAAQGPASPVDSWLFQDAQGHGDRDGGIRGSWRGHEPRSVRRLFRERDDRIGGEVRFCDVGRHLFTQDSSGNVAQDADAQRPDVGQHRRCRLGNSPVGAEGRCRPVDDLRHPVLRHENRMARRQEKRRNAGQIGAAASRDRTAWADRRIAAELRLGNGPPGAGPLPRNPPAVWAAVRQQTAVLGAGEGEAEPPGQLPASAAGMEAVRAEPGSPSASPKDMP